MPSPPQTSPSPSAEVAALLERLNPAFPRLGTEITDAAQARRVFDALRTGAPPRTEVPVRDERVDGLALRVYEPPEAPGERTVLFFHGGGFVLGGLESHDELARRLAVGSSTTVVAVDYRLAPEHPYPAALHDGRAAFAHVQATRPGTAVIVAGDSAGGNLATALCLDARDRDTPLPASQVLLYPMLDDTCATKSYTQNGEGFYITATHLRWFWQQYGGGLYAAPARVTDLRGLPPAFIVTAGLDPLRDEGQAYAVALAAAGVSVTSTCYDDGFHGFVAFDLDLAIARIAMTEICEAIETVWAVG